MKDNRYQLYSAALDYFGNYDSKLDPRLKLEFSLLFMTIGFVGFIVSGVTPNYCRSTPSA